MKFLKYLKKYSNNTDNDLIFRSIGINLVDKPTEYKNQIQNEDVLNLIDSLNKELKKFYKGSKYSFDFIIEEKPVNINKLNLKTSRHNWLKKLCFNFNDKLADIQLTYEKQIKYIK